MLFIDLGPLTCDLGKNIFPLSPVELTGDVLINSQCAANVTISFMMHQSFIIHILTY
jgi:hypothetical protein